MAVQQVSDVSNPNSLKQRPRVPGLQRDIDVLKSELLKFISEHGQEGFMPMRKQLRLHGRVDIEKAITRMGGFRRIATLMNLSLAYKHRKPKGYWDNLENLQEEVEQIFILLWYLFSLANFPALIVFKFSSIVSLCSVKLSVCLLVGGRGEKEFPEEFFITKLYPRSIIVQKILGGQKLTLFICNLFATKFCRNSTFKYKSGVFACLCSVPCIHMQYAFKDSYKVQIWLLFPS
jgi:hypothetical protein